MKRILLAMCLVSALLCAGCAKEEANTVPESTSPAPTADNGVDAFLRGENPELIEKYSD